jgi:hypothetical protein
MAWKIADLPPDQPIPLGTRDNATPLLLRLIERLLHGIHGLRNPAAIGTRQSQIEQRQWR